MESTDRGDLGVPASVAALLDLGRVVDPFGQQLTLALVERDTASLFDFPLVVSSGVPARST